MSEPVFTLVIDTGRTVDTGSIEDQVVDQFDASRANLLRYLRTFPALTSQDGEEILQEAFLELFLHLKEGGARSNLAGWLYRVVHNLALKKVAQSKRDFETGQSLATEDVCSTEPSPERVLLESESHQRTLSVVRALAEQDQRCLALRAEGLRYRDIAKVLGISLGGVAKSLERSLARIASAHAEAGRRA